MHRISREHIVYSLDKSHPPVLRIVPGEIVVLETYDARTGTVTSEDDLLDHPHPKGPNPATGPIWVDGAEPGDSLVVEVLRIELAEQGFVAVKGGQGVLGHLAPKYVTRLVPVRDGMVIFNDRIRFPARPMIGVIGTAPAGEGVSCGYPGPHGGNMDHNDVRAGSKVHLPVFVEGALLGIGDVHGSMGEGEISITGLEICAEVTVQVDLLKGERIARPWIELADAWATTGDGDLPDALRIACEEMAALLHRKLGLSLEEAYMLMSLRGDLKISQSCEPAQFPATARMVMPKFL